MSQESVLTVKPLKQLLLYGSSY